MRYFYVMPIIIKKSKSGFRVRYVGNNNEILATSEVLTSKANAIKNAKAMGRLFGVTWVDVTDETDPKYTKTKQYVA